MHLTDLRFPHFCLRPQSAFSYLSTLKKALQSARRKNNLKFSTFILAHSLKNCSKERGTCQSGFQKRREMKIANGSKCRNICYPSALCLCATSGTSWMRTAFKASRMKLWESLKEPGPALIPNPKSFTCQPLEPVLLKSLELSAKASPPWWIKWGQWS